MSDPLGGTTIPLSGQTLVEGKDLRATVTWFTVNDVAVAGIALHWAGSDNEASDTEMLGRTLAMLSDGLASRGIQLRWVQDTLLDATDEYLEAIAAGAGFAEHERQVVLRTRVGGDAGPAGSPGAGRPLDAEADGGRWAQLVARIPEVAGTSPLPPTQSPDRVTVVADAGPDELTAFCWARVSRSAPGAPATAEVYGLGAVPAAEARDRRRAALVAMGDLLAAEGIRTLSMAADEDDDALREELAALGFTPRRQRRTFSRAGR